MQAALVHLYYELELVGFTCVWEEGLKLDRIWCLLIEKP